MALSNQETELLATYGKVWPAPIDRVIKNSSSRLMLDIEGFEPFSAVLLDTAVPQITSALRKVLPFKGHLIHSAWSGSGVRALEAMNLPCVESHENSTYFPAPGDICFTVGHNEFTIFYGDASPAMPSGKVRESVFAIIEARILEFQQACMLTRLTGLRPFSLQFV